MALRRAPDPQKFDALVLEHYGRLKNFVRRYVDSADDADDIVQEVFVRIWERAHEFNFDDPLPYLYQATRNAATSAARKEKVRARWRESTAREVPQKSESADAHTERGELEAAIARAVDALPERCRLIFTMHREQGLSYDEIARVLGLSVKTVDNQMGRALKSLRIQLAPYLKVILAVILGAGKMSA
jgi:RNA polymerase sigma-70 factor, ECF subfamily